MQQATGNEETDVVTRERLDRLGMRVETQMSGRLRDFRLQWAKRGLVLRGQANSYYAKQLAQHAVMNATKLPILHNEIEVL